MMFEHQGNDCQKLSHNEMTPFEYLIHIPKRLDMIKGRIFFCIGMV